MTRSPRQQYKIDHYMTGIDVRKLVQVRNFGRVHYRLGKSIQFTLLIYFTKERFWARAALQRCTRRSRRTHHVVALTSTVLSLSRYGSGWLKYKQTWNPRLYQNHVSHAKTKSTGSSARWQSRPKSAIQTFCACWRIGRIRTSTAWRLSFVSKRHCSLMSGNSRIRLISFVSFIFNWTKFRSCLRRKQST